MIVIPAIDIKAGRCVRLLQGRMDAETVFSDDPAAMAERWEADGAGLIHVVDLDGAIEKQPCNLPAIRNIVDRVRIPVQVGGGIRDMDTIGMYLEHGVSRVVIGSEAVNNPELVEAACRKWHERIVVGIDARNGWVAIEGWTKTTTVSAAALGKQFESSGVAAINFTDIERDGMRSGPNIEAIREFARSIHTPVVASGGVSAIEDIYRLAPLETDGVVGVITGRALYDGSLDLKQTVSYLQGRRSSRSG